MALIDNIVAYWKLDESSGNASDATGNGLTLTNNGTTGYATGLINNGVKPTGTATWLSRATPPITTPGTDWTVSLWIKLTNEITANFYTMYDSAEAPLGQTQTIRYAFNSGTRRIEAWGGIATAQVNYNVTLGTTNWHHIVLANTGSTGNFHLYVDGTDVGNATDNLSAATSAALTIGQPIGGSSGNWTDGTIDEIGVWTRTLSGAEITSLYNSGAGLQYPFTTTSQPLFTLLGVGT